MSHKKLRPLCNSTFPIAIKSMSHFNFRGFLVLVCVGILASQPYNVFGLRSQDLALRWEEGQLPFVRSFRVLKVVAMEDLKSKMESAPAPSMTFDPNRSNKRTVRKGSDPIHNRCWQALAMSFFYKLSKGKRICDDKIIVLCFLNPFFEFNFFHICLLLLWDSVSAEKLQLRQIFKPAASFRTVGKS